jgi:hypothetical protein
VEASRSLTNGSSEAAVPPTGAHQPSDRSVSAVRAASAAPRSPRVGRAVATAIVMANAPASEGGPAAALPWGGRTVLRRLLGQLRALDVRRTHVVTRPAWDDELASSLAGHGIEVSLHVSPTVSEDFHTVAEIARGGEGPIIVLNGEIVTHGEALAGLLLDPRVVTGALSRHRRIPQYLAPRTRTTRGRIMSASSAYHATARPNTSQLGVVKIGESDRSALVDVAEHLASLTKSALPPGWEEEFELKESRWRRSLAGDDATDDEVGVHKDGHGAFAASDEGVGAPAAGLHDDYDDVLAPLSTEAEAEVALRRAALRENVVALLLVGLVRADVHVVNSYLRALFWARPLSLEAVRDAAERIEDYDEDRVLLDSAVKANDGFFTTFFVSPYSKYIASWAARRGLTPNQVTSISMTIGILAAAIFATGSRPGLVTGAVLLQLAFTADCVDGQLARYTRQFSKLGAWLDSIFDRTKEYIVFAGLAVGAVRGFEDDVWVLAVAAITLQTVRHMADFSFGARQTQAIASEERPPIEEPGDGLLRGPQRLAVLPTSLPEGGDDLDPAATHPPSSPLLFAEPVIDVPSKPSPPLTRRIVTGLTRRALGGSRALDRWRWTRWLKKILVFPIGERFAVISVTAAVATPRFTFIVVLAWGGLAMLYQLAGRSVRSLSQ